MEGVPMGTLMSGGIVIRPHDMQGPTQGNHRPTFTHAIQRRLQVRDQLDQVGSRAYQWGDNGQGCII